MTITKVLLNVSPLDVRPVEIPEGWRRVWRGALKPGDRYLNCTLLRFDGLIAWEDVEIPTDAAVERAEPNSTAAWFTLVIRREDGSVDEPCEQCEVQPKRPGYRFCAVCCRVVVKAARERALWAKEHSS